MPDHFHRQVRRDLSNWKKERDDEALVREQKLRAMEGGAKQSACAVSLPLVPPLSSPPFTRPPPPTPIYLSGHRPFHQLVLPHSSSPPSIAHQPVINPSFLSL
ncbi:unnamed protein product [Caenorhabditis angaria]|uniref:Uncharacterized protein n=1 Tax=Caenorhabditis angaria TaxID=860376 RepID=A0A9P1NCF6_9PELO|nr:unnamed protein product [Caenorhabditis angaria]